MTMKFYGNEHKALINRLEQLWTNLHGLSALAKEFGIDDIFQDAGCKMKLQ